MSAVTLDTLATKQDIARLELKLTEHDGEFKLIKWTLVAVLALTTAAFAKQYF
jgi:hypothetical protein